MKKMLMVFAVVLGFFSFVPSAMAMPGKIFGVIVSASGNFWDGGNGVPWARISFFKDNGTGNWEYAGGAIPDNDNGEYSLSLPAGNYKVRAEAEQFYPEWWKDENIVEGAAVVKVQDNWSCMVNFSLYPEQVLVEIKSSLNAGNYGANVDVSVWSKDGFSKDVVVWVIVEAPSAAYGDIHNVIEKIGQKAVTIPVTGIKNLHFQFPVLAGSVDAGARYAIKAYAAHIERWMIEGINNPLIRASWSTARRQRFDRKMKWAMWSIIGFSESEFRP